MRNRFLVYVWVSLVIAAPRAAVSAGETPAPQHTSGETPATKWLFGRENLVAWCIVPFDRRQRSPEERAEMLARLGFRHFAYDWRAEHLPTFERELDALKAHGISLDAVWFPAALNDDAKTILTLLERRDLHTQLWITMGDPAPQGGQSAKLAAAVATLKLIAAEADKIGCQVALYNHGGWFGEPENQLAVIEQLGMTNVGIVYNLHHGHDHLDRLETLLRKMRPHLLALNLNGMTRQGDRFGQKILPLSQGEVDLPLLRTICASGYRGPIGILGHTMDDAQERLQDNLDGLDWLVAQLDGTPPGPKPTPRTPVGEAPGDLPDQSGNENAAKLTETAPTAQGPAPTAGVNFELIGADGSVELIDRSRADAYLGVKVDGEGRAFVGAREAVYRFEPDVRGDFKLRQEVCRLPADSIVMGLEFRGDDLYVLANNALYLLPGGRVQIGVKPRRILWGLPLDLHVSFHCLAWGPEGDLYLTHGDPLLNYGDWNRPDHWGHWTLYSGPDGEPVPYTGVGAVLRVRPNGSQVRVVAGGLRGPVGLAFDPQWNLFTNDNDHESRADLYAPARLLHVTPHIDFAWPRGWIASKSPRRFDLVEPLTSELGRGVPCDLAWWTAADGSDSLIMARWDQMAVHRYVLEPRGASFSAKEVPFLRGRDSARPVGLAAASDGRLFVTSLYLGGNVWSPNCYSDLVLITTGGGQADRCNVVKASADELWRELSQPDWPRRQRAHQEILRRGGELLVEAAQRMSMVGDDDPAAAHLPWLAAASGSGEARKLLMEQVRDRRDERRLQALRALAEFDSLQAPDELFAEALHDSAPAVRLAALAALFDRRGALPIETIARLAAGDDTYLRQTAARLLAQRARIDDLARLRKSETPPLRRAGVLAVGFRLTVPPHDFVPPESLPLSYTAGNAAFALTFADAEKPIDLRALGRVGSFTTADWWKFAPRTTERQQLFDLLVAALDDSQSDVVEQAAYFLSLLNDPHAEPLIAEARRRVLAREAASFPPRRLERAWVLPIADDQFVLENVSPPERGPIDLAAKYTAGAVEVSWADAQTRDGRFMADPQSRSGLVCLYCCFQLQSTSRQAATIEISGGGSPLLWHNGRAIAAASDAFAVELQPGGNDFLVRLDRPEADGVSLAFRAAKNVVATLPEKLDAGMLAERLRQAATGADQVAAELLSVDWTNAVGQGDAQRGRALFGSLGCVKCHGITLEQAGGGGPNLADVRRRFNTAYVVESILLPSKQVADPFRAATLALADGRTLTGLVLNDTQTQVELLQPDAVRVTIAKEDIDERVPSTLSPMPSGLVKTEQELRDLLAYLFSERPTPP